MNRSSIHRLRISLDNVEPAIWRELEVESEWPIDFVGDSIRCVFGWSFDHAYKFVVKRRHYGTFNGWVRLDPEQEYEERRLQIARQKLGPRQERQVLKELYAWLQSLRKDCEAEEDPIPSLMELAPRAGTKFKFVYDFGDCGSTRCGSRESNRLRPGRFTLGALMEREPIRWRTVAVPRA